MSWLLSLFAPLALAQDLTVSSAERGLVAGRGGIVLGVDAGAGLAGGAVVPRGAFPARFGLGDSLELFMAPTLQTAEPKISDPALGATWRLVDGDLEVAARVAGDMALFGPTKSAVVDVGVPVRYHAGPALAIDAGGYGVIGVVPGTTVGLRVPVGATFNPTEPLAIRAASGVSVADLSAPAVAAPLEVGASWTVARDDAPLVEVGAAASWADVQATDVLIASLQARYFITP